MNDRILSAVADLRGVPLADMGVALNEILARLLPAAAPVPVAAFSSAI